jgi:hypothetical protein
MTIGHESNALALGRDAIREFYAGTGTLADAGLFADAWQRKDLGTFLNYIPPNPPNPENPSLLTGLIEVRIPFEGWLWLGICEVGQLSNPPTGDPDLLDTDGPRGAFNHARRPRGALSNRATGDGRISAGDTAVMYSALVANCHELWTYDPLMLALNERRSVRGLRIVEPHSPTIQMELPQFS